VQRVVRGTDPVGPGQVDGGAVAGVDRDGEVRSDEAFLPEGELTLIDEWNAAVLHDQASSEPVGGVDERRERRRRSCPVVADHDHVCSGDASDERRPPIEGGIDRPVPMNRRADRRSVLP
jgi:hypothetical protein